MGRARYLKDLSETKFTTVKFIDSQYPGFQQRVEDDGYFYKNRSAVLELGGVNVQDVDNVVHNALYLVFIHKRRSHTFSNE